MKIARLFLIALPILIVLNLLGIDNPDIRVYGLYILAFLFSLVALFKYGLWEVLAWMALLFVIDLLVRLMIDGLLQMDTANENGQVVPMHIKLIAQLAQMLTAYLGIALMAGVKRLFSKKKKVKFQTQDILDQP